MEAVIRPSNALDILGSERVIDDLRCQLDISKVGDTCDGRVLNALHHKVELATMEAQATAEDHVEDIIKVRSSLFDRSEHSRSLRCGRGVPPLSLSLRITTTKSSPPFLPPSLSTKARGDQEKREGKGKKGGRSFSLERKRGLGGPWYGREKRFYT